MSTMAVSIAPAFTAFFKSSKERLPAILNVPLSHRRQTFIDDIKRAVHLRLGDDQRRRQGQYVPERRLERQSMLKRAIHHFLGLHVGRRLGVAIGDELDAEHKAE